MSSVCTKNFYRDELHEQWEICNAIVLSWIMSFVGEELLNKVFYATIAFMIWQDLNNRFEKVYRLRVYQLHKEITTLSHKTNFVTVYFDKLKHLWGEYNAAIPLHSCDSPKLKDYVDHLTQI